MRPKLLLCLALVLCSGLFYAPSVKAGSSLPEQLEELAKTNVYFSRTVIIANRPLRLATSWEDLRQQNPLAAEQLQLAGKLQAWSSDLEALKPLLTNADPKVRTLALGAIFQRERGQDLPLIAALLNDSAPTFPDLHESMSQQGGPRPLAELTSTQTVGMVAQAMLAFWRVRHEGFLESPGWGRSELLTSYDFAAYWQTHKDRDYCAGWFAVKLARAGRNIDPTPKEYVTDIHKVRQEINRLPADDRVWTLLWLYGEYGSDALTDESELVRLSKQLGPQKLMLMLQRKIPSTDPDLQPGDFDDWAFKRMTGFVLSHASELLRPEDADELLATGKREEDGKSIYRLVTPWSAIAAAHLQPQRAGDILHAAFAHFAGRDEYHAEMRADLAVALWELRGNQEMKFLTDWFYTEFPSQQLWVNWRRNFIENISQVKKPSSRTLVVHLVTDSRYETIDWDVASLKSLVNVINGWLGKPPIPQDEIDRIRMDTTAALKKQLLENLKQEVTNPAKI